MRFLFFNFNVDAVQQHSETCFLLQPTIESEKVFNNICLIQFDYTYWKLQVFSPPSLRVLFHLENNRTLMFRIYTVGSSLMWKVFFAILADVKCDALRVVFYSIIFLIKWKLYRKHMRIYFFHIFTIVGLTFVAITKRHDLPVRAHVDIVFPAQTRYNSLSVGMISI